MTQHRSNRPPVATLALALALTVAGCSGSGEEKPDSGPLADGGVLDGAPMADGSLAPDQTAPDAPAAAGELQRLAAWMTGSFGSEQQSLTDPSYYNITLAMRRIWPQATGESIWLYVEQAMAGQLPYRQRVYRLQLHAPGTCSSRIYEFATTQLAAQAVGAWKQPDPLSTLNEQDLVEKKGCAVYLRWNAVEQSFEGSTRLKACTTTYQGASYTTSDVEVTEKQLTSWDRGFDTAGKQVWGAVKGPYVFDKLQNLDPELDPS